jgi:beta-lactam-binding protein with PASTA domain
MAIFSGNRRKVTLGVGYAETAVPTLSSYKSPNAEKKVQADGFNFTFVHSLKCKIPSLASYNCLG